MYWHRLNGQTMVRRIKMVKKLVNTIQRHDHWFAEWWSSVFLLAVGIYGLYQQNSFIIQQSFIDGFLQFMPAKI